MKNMYNFVDKTVLYLIFIAITVLLECKTDMRNSQCEHGQPI